MSEEHDILKRALEREKAARKAAEKILEEKSRELYAASQNLQHLLDEKTWQLNGFLENIIDAYVLMDINGDVLKLNEAATKLFGYDIDKESLNVLDLIYKEDYQYTMLSFKDLYTKGFFKDYEARVYTKSGEVKWVHINASIVFDKDKTPLAAQGIVRDITDQKASEEKLIESKNRLATLVLNLDSGIVLEDENRKIVLTNNKFCELFKIDLEPIDMYGIDCSVVSRKYKILFKDPEAFMQRMTAIEKEKKAVIGDELEMLDGKIIERNYMPIVLGEKSQGGLWTFTDVTLKRTYSKSLESQKQKYYNIIANMNLGLVEVNNNDKILMINQSFAEMSGYTEAELIGKETGKLFPLEGGSRIISKENNKRKRGESNTYEIKAETKSKEVREWLISGVPNYDDKGQVIGFIGIYLDVTEAKRNTTLIQEQKEELGVIVNNSSIGIVLTENSQIVRTNATFQNMLGFSESELNTCTIKDLSFNEDYPVSKAYIEQINAGEIDNFVVTKRYKKKDGSVIWAKTNVNAVRDKDGKVKYQVALIEDITLDREKTLIIDLVNNLTKSIFGKIDIKEIAWEIVNNIAEYLDSDDCVIYLVDYEKETLEQVAAYGYKLTGENKIINKLIFPIGTGIVGSVVKSGKSELIKDTSKDSRYVVDDKRRLSEITVPIISNGKVIGVIDSEHEDKNYYTDKHIKTLESISSLVAIKLRTALSIREREKAEALNVQLLVELEKSNEELQEYAHIVSHDLKSPLRSIDALISWLKEDNKGIFDDVSLRNFGLIETTLEKMELLISDILLYSSIGTDTTDVNDIDLNQLVLELKQILFVPGNISIEILNKLPLIKGDKTKLQQVFQNIISNAVKFNDKEKGLIEIDVIEQKSFYQFSIKDNGIGVDKKYHDTIFKIFHSLNKSKDSSGIGLSIVKKIVDLYNGEIWLESIPNEGTTFYFTLKK